MTLCDEAEARSWHPSVPEDRVRDAWLAAEGYVARRCGEHVPAPGELRQAVRLLTGRYLARHNSPDGLAAGGGELGPARIASTDRDVAELIGPYRRVVIG